MSFINKYICRTGNEHLICPRPWCHYAGVIFFLLYEIKLHIHSLQLYGGNMSMTDRRMSAERCAHLSLVALAHGLEEAWITFFPILPIMYFTQYMPTTAKR